MNQENHLSKTSFQSKSRCQKQCSDKLILRNQIFTELNCQVMFCPKFNKQKNTLQNIFPVFNKDNKFYTSSFVLGLDKKTLQKNDHIQHKQYQRQINPRKIETNLTFPKPKKNNRFCMVCNSQYQNYFQHIKSLDHRSQIEANIFSKQIQLLAQKFGNFDHKTLYQDSTKLISTQDVEENQNTDLDNISSKEDQQSQDDDSHQALFSESSYENGFQKDINELQQIKKVIEHCEKSQKLEDLKKQNAQQDSIEIIAIKPAKTPRNPKRKQKNKYEEKQQKRKKKQKKLKKKKKSIYKQKSKKKSHKNKHKKQRKQRKEKRKKSKMKIQIDSPPLTSPLVKNKMTNRAGLKSVHPPKQRQELVLIQKNQIEDAELDLANQKILQNIVATINKGPPPQAPRQYRKAGAPIDFKIPAGLQIHQNFNTIGQHRGNGLSHNAPQFKANQENKIVSTDENYTNFLAKLSTIGNQQEKQSKISIISDTNNISMNFDKIREKADWQKLKNKLISSNRNQRQLVVISLDDESDEQTSAFISPKNELHSNLPNHVSSQKQKLITLSTTGFYIQNHKNFKINQFNQQKQPLTLKRDQISDRSKYFKHKNEQINIDVARKQVSYPEENRMAKYFHSTTLQIQQKNLPKRISNSHLTRKYCNEHHQLVNKEGIIDLEIDEIEKTQAIIHRRDDSFSNLPKGPSENLIKFIDKYNGKVPEGQKVYRRFK